MKTLFAALIFSSLAQAQSNSSLRHIEGLVMRDLNSVLSETYDEGEGTASASRAGCRIMKTKPQSYVVYCSIEVIVQPDTRRRYKAKTVCTSMGYEFSKSLKSYERLDGWERCLETVNDITEY